MSTTCLACGKPATHTRIIESVAFDLCAECAEEIDRERLTWEIQPSDHPGVVLLIGRVRQWSYTIEVTSSEETEGVVESDFEDEQRPFPNGWPSPPPEDIERARRMLPQTSAVLAR